MKIVGSLGVAQEVLRNRSGGAGSGGGARFRSGQVDEFTLDAGVDLGAIASIQVWRALCAFACSIITVRTDLCQRAWVLCRMPPQL